MNCGVGHRHGSYLELLWLWCRPAAIAPIRFLAWVLPYAAPAALKRPKEKKKKKEKRKSKEKKKTERKEKQRPTRWQTNPPEKNFTLRYPQILTLKANSSGKLSIVSNSQEMASQIPCRIIYEIYCWLSVRGEGAWESF